VPPQPVTGIVLPFFYLVFIPIGLLWKMYSTSKICLSIFIPWFFLASFQPSPKLLWHTCGPFASYQCATAHQLKITALDGRSGCFTALHWCEWKKQQNLQFWLIKWIELMNVREQWIEPMNLCKRLWREMGQIFSFFIYKNKHFWVALQLLFPDCLIIICYMCKCYCLVWMLFVFPKCYFSVQRIIYIYSHNLW
jgi:hypothetical protein